MKQEAILAWLITEDQFANLIVSNCLLMDHGLTNRRVYPFSKAKKYRKKSGLGKPSDTMYPIHASNHS